MTKLIHLNRYGEAVQCTLDVLSEGEKTIDVTKVTCRACLLWEIERLRWRLNHQCDEDVYACDHGNHGPDCGRPWYIRAKDERDGEEEKE